MQKRYILMMCLFLIVFAIILYNILNPKLTKENVVNEFVKNKQHFEVVKNYLLTKDGDYYINIKSYNEDIKDENIKESTGYLVNKVGYKRIYNFIPENNQNTKYVVFLRGGNDRDEFGIIYTEQKRDDYGMTMDLIGDGWYFHWMGYN